MTLKNGGGCNEPVEMVYFNLWYFSTSALNYSCNMLGLIMLMLFHSTALA